MSRWLAWCARWLPAHAPELSLVLLGILMRVAALRMYDVRLGYDYFEHEPVVTWWTQHWSMPPLALSRGASHSQLMYVVGGVAERLGATIDDVQMIPAGLGCARLLLLWWALERYLPTRRLVRLLVLGLAAGMPVSLHMDVMLNQEPFSNFWMILFIIGVMELGSAPTERRLRWGIALGCVGGLALLTKVSNLILPAALGFGALLELVQRRDLPLQQRVKRTYAWLAGICLSLLLASPQYIYNRQVYGKAIISGWYKRPTAALLKDPASKRELLDRRTLGFVFSFNADVVRFPYYPSGLHPTPRFWPTLIGSSFSDYYNYSFNRPRDAGGTLGANSRSVGGMTTVAAQASVASGIGISALAALGWLVAMPRMLLKREVARSVVLALPLLGVLGVLSMAIESPYDFEGIVKGHYFHFASWPLYALFGTSVAWLARRRGLAPLGWLGAMLIVPPFIYSWICVMR